MLPEQQQRIMGYFIEEAKDHLNTIEQGLLNLQATIEDPEMANEVFRAAHSVKGGAAMLGLESIQRTSHRMEDYFKILKESPVKADRTLESMFLQVFDALQEQLEQLQGPFGLTDDKAEEIMAGVEPVFGQLEEHLSGLVETVGGEAQATPSPAPAKAAVTAHSNGEDSALQLVFKSDVSSYLRDMLGLFKQADTEQSRQSLQDICRQLAGFGEQFDLAAWVNLVVTAEFAIANSENDYRTLAPVLIKEIKGAQDLVLAGREPEVQVSDTLQSLIPEDTTSADLDLESLALDDADTPVEDPSVDDLFGDTTDLAIDDLSGLAPSESATGNMTDEGFDDLFTDTANADLDSLENPAGSSDLGLDDLEALPDISEGDLGSADLSLESGGLEGLMGGGADPTGPEVGAAELNSLADLFEGDLGDLDDTWQEEEVALENATEDVPDVDISSDFADLLETGDGDSSATLDSGDELADLFGEVLDDTASTDEADSLASLPSDDLSLELDDLAAVVAPSEDTETADDLDLFSNELDDLSLDGDTAENGADNLDLDLPETAEIAVPISDTAAELEDELSLGEVSLDDDLANLNSTDTGDDLLGLNDLDGSNDLALDLADELDTAVSDTDTGADLSLFDDLEQDETLAPSESGLDAALDLGNDLESNLTELDDADTDELDLDALADPINTGDDSGLGLDDELGDLELEIDDAASPIDVESDSVEDALNLDEALFSDAATADTDMGDLFADSSPTTDEPALSDNLDLTFDDADLTFDNPPEDTAGAAASVDDLGLEFPEDPTDMVDESTLTEAETGLDLEDLDLEIGDSSTEPAENTVSPVLDAPQVEGNGSDLGDLFGDVESDAELAGDLDLALDIPATGESTGAVDADNTALTDLEFATDESAAPAEDDSAGLDLGLEITDLNDDLDLTESHAEAPALDELDLSGENDLSSGLSLDEELPDAAFPSDGSTPDDGMSAFFSEASPTENAANDALDGNSIDDFFDVGSVSSEQTVDSDFWSDPDPVVAETTSLETVTDATDTPSAPSEDSLDLDNGLAGFEPEALDTNEAAPLSEDLGGLIDSSHPSDLEADLWDNASEANIGADSLDALNDLAPTADEDDDLGLNALDLEDLNPLSSDAVPPEESPEDGIDTLTDDLWDDASLASAGETSDDDNGLADLPDIDGSTTIESTDDLSDFGADFELDLGDNTDAANTAELTLDPASAIPEAENDLAPSSVDDLDSLDALVSAAPESDTDLNFGDNETSELSELDALLDSPANDDDGLSSELDDLLGDSTSPLSDEAAADLDHLLADEPTADTANPPLPEATTAESDFSELDALLDDPAPAAEAPAASEDFADLEALLADGETPPTAPTAAPGSNDGGGDEFEDLEKLLEEADQTLGGPTGSSSTRRTASTSNRLASRRPSGVLGEQTMRVSVKHLDNLSNLVG
ncbi:MAG: Hpt domain-containing protein, partial [Cyanobacteria bacterium J06632_22]